jgi:hypothetical protein
MNNTHLLLNEIKELLQHKSDRFDIVSEADFSSERVVVKDSTARSPIPGVYVITVEKI